MRGSTEAQNAQNWNRNRVSPPGPTQHLPGTEEKMIVMMERLEQGFHLHHPDDARHQSDLDISFRCLGHSFRVKRMELPRRYRGKQ